MHASCTPIGESAPSSGAGGRHFLDLGADEFRCSDGYAGAVGSVASVGAVASDTCVLN